MKKSDIIKRKRELLVAQILGMAIIVSGGYGIAKNLINERDNSFGKLATIESYAPDNVQDDIHKNNYNSRFGTILGIELAGNAALVATSLYYRKN